MNISCKFEKASYNIFFVRVLKVKSLYTLHRRRQRNKAKSIVSTRCYPVDTIRSSICRTSSWKYFDRIWNSADRIWNSVKISWLNFQLELLSTGLAVGSSVDRIWNSVIFEVLSRHIYKPKDILYRNIKIFCFPFYSETQNTVSWHRAHSWALIVCLYE